MMSLISRRQKAEPAPAPQTTSQPKQRTGRRVDWTLAACENGRKAANAQYKRLTEHVEANAPVIESDIAFYSERRDSLLNLGRNVQDRSRRRLTGLQPLVDEVATLLNHAQQGQSQLRDAEKEMTQAAKLAGLWEDRWGERKARQERIKERASGWKTNLTIPQTFADLDRLELLEMRLRIDYVGTKQLEEIRVDWNRRALVDLKQWIEDMEVGSLLTQTVVGHEAHQSSEFRLTRGCYWRGVRDDHDGSGPLIRDPFVPPFYVSGDPVDLAFRVGLTPTGDVSANYYKLPKA